MLDWALDHPDFIVLGLQGVVLAVIWLLKRSFASKADIDEAIKMHRAETDKAIEDQGEELKSIGAAVARTAGDLVLLGKDLKALPSSEDIAEIKLSISEIEGDYKEIRANVGNMKDHIGSIGKSVDRIEDYMMQAAKAQRA